MACSRPCEGEAPARRDRFDADHARARAGRELRDRDAIIRETLASGSTKANPRPVAEADVAALLDRLFAAP